MKYEFDQSESTLRCWLSERVQLEGDELARDIRYEVRTRLAKMASCTAFEGTWTSRDPPGLADLDNVLFSNLGDGTFSSLGFARLSLRRRYATPPLSPTGRAFPQFHQYDRFIHRAPLHVEKRCLATRAFPVPQRPVTSWSVWRAALENHASSDSTIESRRLGLHLAITLPSDRGLSIAWHLKPLIDGIVGSLSEPSLSDVDRVGLATLVAEKLGCSVADISRLFSVRGLALGRRNLIVRRVDSLQMNPADNLIDEIEIEVFPSGGRHRHAGCVATIYEPNSETV